ncbi:MAG: tetratricopeptide repeat protein, partial [Candidatus Omnitrophica bacterium]|nr:tetratricopeptide repeat protein [Candidatus Omnitrophota bacterium]
LLHAVSGALLYLILLRITGKARPALFAALIFAVHPVQIESFVWISARKHVLAAALLFASFLCHIGYREKKRPSYQAMSMICFLLALLSNPVSVMFPFLLMAYDFLILKWTSPLKFLKEHGPNLLIAVTFGFIFIQAAKIDGYFRNPASTPFPNLNPLLAPFLTYQYVLLALFPLKQSFAYDVPHPTNLIEIIGVVILGLWTIHFIKYTKRRWEMAFWSLWFLIFLLPTFFLPQHSLIHDRYLYLPIAGLTMFLIRFSRDEENAPQKRERFRRLRFSILCLLGIAYSFAAFQRSLIWRDNFTLMRDTLKKTPAHYFSHLGMGLAWLAEGYYDRALTRFEAALKAPIKPHSYDVVYGAIGEASFLKDDDIAGVDALKKAIAQAEKPIHYINLGFLYRRSGELDKATQANRRAIELGAKDPVVYNNMGLIYEEQKQYGPALEAYRKAMELDPHFSPAFENFIHLIKRSEK